MASLFLLWLVLESRGAERIAAELGSEAGSHRGVSEPEDGPVRPDSPRSLADSSEELGAAPVSDSVRAPCPYCRGERALPRGIRDQNTYNPVDVELARHFAHSLDAFGVVGEALSVDAHTAYAAREALERHPGRWAAQLAACLTQGPEPSETSRVMLAIEGISILGVDRCRDALVHAASTDQRANVRARALTVLGRNAPHGLLLRSLGDPEPDVRLAAIALVDEELMSVSPIADGISLLADDTVPIVRARANALLASR